MGEYRQALCPVCGSAHGKVATSRVPGKPSIKWNFVNYWERIKDFDPDKPFGVIQGVGLGRGRSFKHIGYFSPEEDIDGYFPLVKLRLLNAVKEWLNKGWLSKDEIRDLIED